MTIASLPKPLTLTVGRSTLVVGHRDIVTLPVDVIVSSEDTALSMSGGAAGAIRKAAGEEYARDAQRHRPAKVGDVVVTLAGALPHRNVFHAIVLDATGQAPVTADGIRKVVRRCLELGVELGVRSIGFPALGTGAARLEPEQSAAAILVEAVSFLETDPPMDVVHIAIHPDRVDVADRFFRQVEEYRSLAACTRVADDAVSDLERYADRTPAHATNERRRIEGVRAELDKRLIEAPTREPDATSSQQVAELLNTTIAEFDKVLREAKQRTGEDDPSNTRLRAELLRLQRQNAFIERQRVEWEATANGPTPERQRRIEQLREQERKFSEELAALDEASRPVVISIHGIRTRGTWQKELTPALNYAGFTHVPLDYGRFGLLRFLWRPARQRRVDAFRDAYRYHGGRTTKGAPSLIAHSLGTYIVTEAIAKYNLQFDQVIFCGAIVKRDYDWDSICAGRLVTRVLNDYGGLDTWARVAEVVVRDAGQSGLKGFEREVGGKVKNRRHARFGHSDYFFDENYTEAWIPFLRGADPAPPVNPAETRANWKFRVTIGVLIAAAIAYFVLFR